LKDGKIEYKVGRARKWRKLTREAIDLADE